MPLGIEAGRCIVVAAARISWESCLKHRASCGKARRRFAASGVVWWASHLPLAVRTALEAGDSELAERLAGGFDPLQPLSHHAIVAAQALLGEARGEHEAAAAGFADAAARWHDFGMPYEEAQALLGQGRCLVALGRAPEAAAAARAGARDLRATRCQACADRDRAAAGADG